MRHLATAVASAAFLCLSAAGLAGTAADQTDCGRYMGGCGPKYGPYPAPVYGGCGGYGGYGYGGYGGCGMGGYGPYAAPPPCGPYGGGYGGCGNPYGYGAPYGYGGPGYGAPGYGGPGYGAPGYGGYGKGYGQEPYAH